MKIMWFVPVLLILIGAPAQATEPGDRVQCVGVQRKARRIVRFARQEYPELMRNIRLRLRPGSRKSVPCRYLIRAAGTGGEKFACRKAITRLNGARFGDVPEALRPAICHGRLKGVVFGQNGTVRYHRDVPVRGKWRPAP